VSNPESRAEPRTRRGWRTAFTAVSILAAATATIFVVRQTGADIATTFTRLPLRTHILALSLFSLEILARGVRVFIISRGMGLPIPLRLTTAAQVAGDAVGTITPARVGADAAKIGVLTRSGVRVGPCGAILLGEMAFEVLALVLSAAAVAVFATDHRWVALGLLGYAGIVSVTGAMAVVVTKLPGDEPPRLLGWLRVNPAHWVTLRRIAAEFRERSRELLKLSPMHLVGAFAAALVHIGARLMIIPVLAWPLVVGDGAVAGAMVGGAAVTGAAAAADVPWAEWILIPYFTLYATALFPMPTGGGGVELTFASLMEQSLPGATLGLVLVWWRIYTQYLAAGVGGLTLAILPRLAKAGDGEVASGRTRAAESAESRA
jgi:uncharacterized membrane protein YbhN (UPF0104 family)